MVLFRDFSRIVSIEPHGFETMFVGLHTRICKLALCLFVFVSTANASTPQWIWGGAKTSDGFRAGACYFRRTFDVDAPKSGRLEIAADDTFEVFVNGHRVGRGEQWKHLTSFDVSDVVLSGKNTVAIKAVNQEGGPAGLVVKLDLVGADSERTTIVSDSRWKTSLRPLPLWHQTRHADVKWDRATVIGPHGETAPWIVHPLPTAREITAAKSPTKPERVQTPDGLPGEVVSFKTRQLYPKRSLRRNSLARSATHEAPVQSSLATTPPPRADISADALAQVNVGPNRALPRTRSRARSGPASNQRRQGPRPRKTIADMLKPLVGQLQSRKPSPSRQNRPADLPVERNQTAPPLKLPGKSEEGSTSDSGMQVKKVHRPAQSQQFKPREGFSVEQLLAHRDTGSLISLSFNEFGQILAGREEGPLLLIVDTDGDNRPDEVRTYCDVVKNCQGILALSGSVFVVAEGPEGTGLYRLNDEDRDGTLEKALPLALFDVTVGEHGPHGIALGPDGNLYVMVGNHAKLKAEFAKLGPRRHLYDGDLIPRYEDPGGHARGIRTPGGFVLRTDIDGQNMELFASGLRNAYDLAFNNDGQLFTYDSDMESDQGTTWYRPTRLYHVLPGAEFGWRSGWAKWPSYYHDALPPVLETGRGSPTGIVFYQHTAYPRDYRGTAFLADWSEGRILMARLRKHGASYEGQTEVFLEGTPLNVCDLEVGLDGALYFVTGGRGTQGNLFRVIWNETESDVVTQELNSVHEAVSAPQLHSSWARQQLAAVQHRLGDKWNVEIRAAATNESLPPEQRLQALQIMQWVGPIPDANLLLELTLDDEPSVRRMATFFMSGSKDSRVPARLVELLGDHDDYVKRQACESLVRSHKSVDYEYIEPLLQTDDRALAWAARRLLAQSEPAEWHAKALNSPNIRVFIQAATTMLSAKPTGRRAVQVVDQARVFMRGFVSDEDFIDLLRVLQLAVMQGELTADDVPELAAELADEFPAQDNTMNRELIRLLTRLQVTSIADRYLEHLQSSIPDHERIHLAIHMRFLNAKWTPEQKLQLFKFMEVKNDVGNSVPGYLQNVARDFGRTLSAAEQRYALKHANEYPSAAMAAVLLLPRKLSPELIRQLIELDNSVTADQEVSRRLKVAIVATLAQDGRAESMEHLRNIYDSDPHRRLEVVIGLAEKPAGKNWGYLVRSLPLLEGELAREILVKLRDVDRTPNDAESYRQVIMSGLRLGDSGGNDAVRLLEYWQGFASTAETPPWNEALKAWQKWFVQTYPNRPLPQLEVGNTGSKWDYDALLNHLQNDGVREASLERGQAVFVAQCAKCHRHGDVGESMGPDLTTVGKRFLTKEILDSVVYPSRVISDQYKAKTIITANGKSYTGTVGSGGSEDLLILQADGRKIRVPREEVEQTVPSQVSSMPEGLLNDLTLEEVSDLFAFLQTPPPEVVTQRP